MTRLSRSSSRVVGFRSVVVVVAVIILDDDRVLPVMMAALDRARDDDCIAVVMPAPGALAIVVKRLLAMVAVMETLSVPIDDHAVVVVVPIMAVVPVGLDDDAFVCGSDRRQSQAKCQRAQNHDFHFVFSKKTCCPSTGKHGATALVPVSRLGGLEIDPRQARCDLDGRSYLAARNNVRGKHFLRPFNGELGLADMLHGVGELRRQSLGIRGVRHVFAIHGGRNRSLPRYRGGGR